MDVNNNTNISAQIANSISKLNLNTQKRSFEAQLNEKTPIVQQQEAKKEDIALINESEVKNKNGVDIEDIQKYANYMGENLSIDDINYGLMYGRSVIADYSI